jgi:hypothetical protein
MGSFGTQPPVLGISALRGPLDTDSLGVQAAPLSSFMYFNNPSVGSPPPATTDPMNAMQFYNYLQGNWRDGSPLTEGGIGYGGSMPADFIFPGLPQQPGGWTEHEAQNPPGDRRLLLSYGPFSLWPGGVNEMITAYRPGWAPGPGRAAARADRAGQRFFRRLFFNRRYGAAALHGGDDSRSPS